MLGPLMRRQRAFTLVELMVVVAVLAIIALIAAPSFGDLILMQRLKSINAQLVTDLQFARSEAVARNTLMRVRFQSNGVMTCYAIYTSPNESDLCDCTRNPGTACTIADTAEVRTVQVPRSLSVQVNIPEFALDAFAFDPVTGGLRSVFADQPNGPLNGFVVDTAVDTPRGLRVQLNRAGRSTVCLSVGSTMPVPSCPVLSQ